MYNEVMKTIKETVKIDGLIRHLKMRDENVCIYEYETNKHWDVMVIQKAKNDFVRTFPNGVEMRMDKGDEFLPSTNLWGKMGWTYMNYNEAVEKFHQLQKKFSTTE
jgi:hypothetical protein